MARRRRARRAAQRKQKEQRTWPRQKRNRMLAWGLSLALAVGAAFSLNSSQPKKKFSSKTPISEPITQKGKVSFQLMLHESPQSAVCSLAKSLETANPDMVFFETTYLLHRDAAWLDEYLNRSDRGVHLETAPYLRGLFEKIIRTSKSYARKAGHDVKLYPLESYSPRENNILAASLKGYERLSKQAMLSLLNGGDVETSMNLMLRAAKILAKHLILRNNRMFKRVSSKMKSPNNSAFIFVGAGHSNLMKLFSKAGYRTTVAWDANIRVLGAYLEALERGWHVEETNERSMVAREMAVAMLHAAYKVARFGNQNEWMAVADSVIQKFSVDELKRLQSMILSGTPALKAFVSLGYQIPTTASEFNKVSKDLGFGTCD